MEAVPTDGGILADTIGKECGGQKLELRGATNAVVGANTILVRCLKYGDERGRVA